MREIEVKAHLRNKEAVMRTITERGCTFSDAVTQNDVVYVEKVGSLETFLSNSIFVRIRETEEETIFTLKYHPDRTQNGSALAMPLEHEVTVSSKKELEEMLRLMGYHEALRITKTRQRAHLNEYEICIDDVDGLGSFIEIEKLAEHDDDVAPVSAELTTLLVSLGIPKEDIGVKRYDIQLLEKQSSGI